MEEIIIERELPCITKEKKKMTNGHVIESEYLLVKGKTLDECKKTIKELEK